MLVVLLPVWAALALRARSRRQRASALLALVAGLLLGSSSAALHQARLHPGEIEDIAGDRRVVGAEVLLTGDPRQQSARPDGAEPDWWANGRLFQVRTRGTVHDIRVPVVVTGHELADAEHGQRLRAMARAGPAWSPQSQSMSLHLVSSVEVVSGPGPVARATNAVRRALREAVASLPPDAAGLLLGLAVGDESLIPPSLEDAMLMTGLTHLTAVSGANTSLVAGLALLTATSLGLRWRARVIVATAVLTAYVALVRPQPSVLRAAAMGGVALLALSTGGRRSASAALLVASGVLLLSLPQLALSIGFALSVAATAGLVLVAPHLAEQLGRWPRTARVPASLRVALAVAVAAHLATMPLVALMGNGLSLVAIPANLAVAPLVPVATILGLAAAVVAVPLPAAATVIAQVAAPVTGLIAVVARGAAGVPGAVVDVPGGVQPALLVALCVAGVIVQIVRGRPARASPLVVVPAAMALVVALLARGVADRGWPPHGWLVLACDVGQGDALVLRRPGASDALLVDAGPDPQAAVACLRDAGIRRAVVLITHYHADHISGLGEVLAGVRVAAILATPVADPEAGAAQVQALAGRARVPIRHLRRGDRAAIAGVDLEVLWPVAAAADSPNDASVVTVVSIPDPDMPAGGLRVLLTGDIEPPAQAELMRGPPVAADVVKVPHHGSRYLADGFAGWCHARIALISVGSPNDYGHPTQEALAAFGTRGVTVGRTDQDGALAVVGSGSGARLVTQR